MLSSTSSSRNHKHVAHVWVARRLPRHIDVFDYAIPVGTNVEIGTGVRVQLRGQQHRGVVVGHALSVASSVRKLLPLSVDRLATQPLCSKPQLDFLAWLAQETLTSPGSLLANTLPPEIQRTTSRARRWVFGIAIQQPTHILPSRLPASIFLSLTTLAQRGALITELLERATPQRPVLVLCPTIDDVRRWIGVLPATAAEETVIVHHAISRGSQLSAYQLVASGKARLILGTRKALLLPYRRLGVVAVDLEEDTSHDQSEQNPRFQLLPVAQQLAKLTGAHFVSWGFSPRLATYHELGQHKRVSSRVGVGRLPTIEILDRRDSGLRFIDRWPQSLLQTIQSADPNAVVAVLAPRADRSNGLRCDACGDVLRCPSCHIPFPVTRADQMTLQCGWCGTTQPNTPTCPHCGSPSLRELRLGSEGWHERLAALVPKRSWHTIEHGGRSLVGTLAEYRRLPDTVDLTIIPDFEGLIVRPDAGVTEEVFHRLWELLRRTTTSFHIVARDAEHPIIRSLGSQRPHVFYASELRERRRFHYPPFTRLIVIRLTSARPADALTQAATLARHLSQHPWKQPPMALSRAFPAFSHSSSGHHAALLTLRFSLPMNGEDWRSLNRLLPVEAVVSVDPMHIE